MPELDRLVDACLMPAFLGPAAPPWALEAAADGVVGFCLYGHNLTGDGPDVRSRVRGIAEDLRAVRPDVLLATDEEGGDVTRLDYLVGSRYPGNLALGTLDDEATTAAVARAIGADLRAVGVDVDLAPSVDVNSDPRNPVIGVRSFGSDPALVARHGAAYVRGLRAAGVAAAVKHFPGHGATVVDSHLGLPVVDVDEATFRARDLPPFAAAVEAGAELVMTSHVVFPAVDALPATHSRRFLVDVLRGELGFEGVVVTDALDMAGVSAEHGIVGAAVRALAAGADLLLLGAVDGAGLRLDVRAAVREEVLRGRLPEARLREAAGRVDALRRALAERRAGVEGGVEGGAGTGGDGAAVGLAAARAAVVPRGDVALPGPAFLVELRAEANMAVGDARWGLREPLAAAGLVADHVAVGEGGPTPDAVVAWAAARPLVLTVRDAYRSSWQRAWVTALLRERPDAVVVALGMPDDAVLTTGPVVRAFGAGRVNAWAAAELLAGRAIAAEPAGPVSIG